GGGGKGRVVRAWRKGGRVQNAGRTVISPTIFSGSALRRSMPRSAAKGSGCARSRVSRSIHRLLCRAPEQESPDRSVCCECSFGDFPPSSGHAWYGACPDHDQQFACGNSGCSHLLIIAAVKDRTCIFEGGAG